jgi:hypothetical protein
MLSFNDQQKRLNQPQTQNHQQLRNSALQDSESAPSENFGAAQVLDPLPVSSTKLNHHEELAERIEEFIQVTNQHKMKYDPVTFQTDLVAAIHNLYQGNVELPETFYNVLDALLTHCAKNYAKFNSSLQQKIIALVDICTSHAAVQYLPMLKQHQDIILHKQRQGLLQQAGVNLTENFVKNKVATITKLDTNGKQYLDLDQHIEAFMLACDQDGISQFGVDLGINFKAHITDALRNIYKSKLPLSDQQINRIRELLAKCVQHFAKFAPSLRNQIVLLIDICAYHSNDQRLKANNQFMAELISHFILNEYDLTSVACLLNIYAFLTLVIHSLKYSPHIFSLDDITKLYAKFNSFEKEQFNDFCLVNTQLAASNGQESITVNIPTTFRPTLVRIANILLAHQANAPVFPIINKMLQNASVELTPQEVKSLYTVDEYFRTNYVIGVHLNLARTYYWLQTVVNVSSVKIKLSNNILKTPLEFYPCAEEFTLLQQHQAIKPDVIHPVDPYTSNKDFSLDLHHAVELNKELAELDARKIPLLTQLLKANQNILLQLYSYCKNLNDDEALYNVLDTINSLLRYSQVADAEEMELKPINFINGALITTCMDCIRNNKMLSNLPDRVLTKIDKILQKRLSTIIESNKTGDTVIYNELLAPLLDDVVKKYIIDNKLIPSGEKIHFKQFFKNIKAAYTTASNSADKTTTIYQRTL